MTSHASDAIAVGLVLAAFGLAGLIYSARVARRTALGDLLLKACASDYRTAVDTVASIGHEQEIGEQILRREFARESFRGRVARFYDGSANDEQ